MLSKVDDRRSRNFVLAALLTLIVIYIIKFSFPLHTVQGAITKHITGHQGSSPQPTKAPFEPKVSAGGEAAAPAFNGAILDRVAVIIEDRPRTNLVALILHFSTILGPEWPVVIYTSSENMGMFSASAALQRHLRSGIISIRILPSTVLFTNSDSVSAFLTKRWIWDSLAPAKYILMFQSDSMLCSNAARSVEDFFEYDFVGAPIAPHLGAGMNGGLSLRKRDTILRILEEWDWEKDKGSRFEDRWYFDRMNDLINREKDGGPPEGYDPVKLPSVEVARTFSVETIDYPHPLGVHQVHRWLGEQRNMDDWCPEYKLCSGEYVQDTHDT